MSLFIKVIKASFLTAALATTTGLATPVAQARDSLLAPPLFHEAKKKQYKACVARSVALTQAMEGKVCPDANTPELAAQRAEKLAAIQENFEILCETDYGRALRLLRASERNLERIAPCP